MKSNILQKSDSFYDIFTRKGGTQLQSTHYCPGCGHGILHKLIAEAISDFGIQDRTVLISPVGCSVFAYYYFDVGNIQSAHGRAPAVATGYKRSNPDSIMISYQGDGDLAAIGANEILQAANRGEQMTVFFVNNAIYGMTGGQMAPTTLIGQKSTTTPRGRSAQNEGFPLRMSEIIATLEAPVYVERVMLTDTKNIARTRKAVRKALSIQIEKKGFSFVEVLSPCPTGWKMTPVNSKKWITDVLSRYFEPGLKKDVSEDRQPVIQMRPQPHFDQYHELLDIKSLSDELKDIALPEIRQVNDEIKIAGFGGQGVLSLGYALANIAMGHAYQVSWLPSYGPEMRGGTANCSVKISDLRVASPIIDNPHTLVAMNKPSLKRFENDVQPGGLILYDSGLIDTAPERKDVQVMGINATEEADALGSTKAANMIMLGAYVKLRGYLSKDYILKALPLIIKNKAFTELNEKAFKRGMELAKI
ncbi:MAG: 2-oxoacid:acceptor oxidoreductase family protein [Candidatus Neomarinimicrobiota bacterium]|jgi:2-oxoisovalerate ferredoxin oxidoreductase beta subunit|nr:2-oxoacid:acceptor oxidoreductase family protein [Candidatus Neomarinimicrobiota bacterium]MDX9780144.1 2-oxoacid:acceptor oxidoreductase family protein [bacterium]